MKQKIDDGPGSMQLLLGYKHQRRQGRDTQVGKIEKQKGLILQYDVGNLAGDYVESQRKDGHYLWYKEQVFNSHPVKLLLKKDRTLYVTFTENKANFYGIVKTEQDLVDAILMLATYSP